MTVAAPATSSGAAVAGGSARPPRVSVVMIFLNARDYIADAIESVRSQTLTDWELVLVDDGSTDGSRVIASGHAARDPDRVRLYEHPGRVNRGTGPSRNLGMRMARGRYLCFLDSDDLFEPTRLARTVELLEADPGLGVVLTRELYWRSWQRNLRGSARYSRLPDEVVGPSARPGVRIPPPVLIASTLATRGAAMPGICSITFRREQVVGSEAIPAEFVSQYEDQALIVKLLLEQTAIVLPECLARYRQHPDSLTHTATARGEYLPGRPHPARRQFLLWIERYLDEHGIEEPVLREAIAKELALFDASLGTTLRDTLQRRLRRAALAVANVALPAALANAIVGAYLERKRIQVFHRAAEHAARVRPRPHRDHPERAAATGEPE